MIVLNTQKTTGKQLYRLIMSCINARAKDLDEPVTKQQFCAESGLSRGSLHNYQNGKRPSAAALVKVARCLSEWGFNVQIAVK